LEAAPGGARVGEAIDAHAAAFDEVSAGDLVAALDDIMTTFDQQTALNAAVPADARGRKGETAAEDRSAKRNGASDHLRAFHGGASPLRLG
jgi:hypothetical protein